MVHPHLKGSELAAQNIIHRRLHRDNHVQMVRHQRILVETQRGVNQRQLPERPLYSQPQGTGTEKRAARHPRPQRAVAADNPERRSSRALLERNMIYGAG